MRASAPAPVRSPDEIVVRIAELDIVAEDRARFISAVTEEMTESLRVEPGVLAIYAVADRDNPNRLRFFEIYANEAAYQQHLESRHFTAYVATTQPMIVSRRLIETVPIQLSSRSALTD